MRRAAVFAAAAGAAALCASASAGPAPEAPERKVLALPGGVELALVRLPGGPWLGETEVTQEQWASVMGSNPSEYAMTNHPVESVAFDGAVAFCTALGALPGVAESGLSFRLPADGEWERACLAGAERPPSGPGLDKTAAHRENARGLHVEAGSFEPNAFGLRDMLGNVWEWVESPDGHVMRGGCAFTPPEDFQALPRAVRNAPGYAHFGLGFRVAAQ